MTEIENAEQLAAFTDWVKVVVSRERDLDILLADIPPGTVTRIIRGQRCKTDEDLFNEWAAALQFPYYFGHNWAAFDECINDLHWLPSKSYLIAVTNIDKVLSSNQESFNTLVRVLKDSADAWSKASHDANWRWTEDPVSFKVLLHVERGQSDKVMKRLGQAGIHGPIEHIPALDAIL